STATALQDPAGGPQRRGGFEHADLNLTADQKTKLESIHRSERDQIQAVRNDASLSPQDTEAKIRSIQDSARQQAMRVLTPEQLQKLKDRRENGPRGFGGRRGPRGGGLGGPPQGQKP